MAKVNKVYPPFYDGVSQQPTELMLDTTCREMVNCVPSIINGLTRRPPAKRITNFIHPYKIVHSYDRGEDGEEYIFLYEDNPYEPLVCYNKKGQKMKITYEDEYVKDYVKTPNLKMLTVQDRTWIANKDRTVRLGEDIPPLSPRYNSDGFYWIKKASGDSYAPYNYAIYIGGVTYQTPAEISFAGVSPERFIQHSRENEYRHDSVKVAKKLAELTRGESRGSIVKIQDLVYNNFSSWDSFGSQASFSWKGSVGKITDLPLEFSWEDTYVRIDGDSSNEFTTYYVKWNGNAWEETRDPALYRSKLKHMPIAMDRISLVSGIATFHIKSLDWAIPKVGNLENNPDPSFVNEKITDLFFYKNRFGIATANNIVMSKVADYENFYIKTALSILDDDPIDLAISSNTASSIHWVKAFNQSLYIFTKDSQFELKSEGYLSPLNVSIENVSNYPVAVDVEPKVINSSLFFISRTGDKQQLREYIKTETLSVEGVDLNATTPDYLSKKITSINPNGVLGTIILGTESNEAYVYNYLQEGGTDAKRIQSAWSKWRFFEGLETRYYEYTILDNNLIIKNKEFRYSNTTLSILDLKDYSSLKLDIGMNNIEYPYTSSILLPQFYPHSIGIGSPKDKMLLKKVTIQGKGNFSSEVKRLDYNKSYYKQHSDAMMKDLDLHIASKVDNVDITISDSTDKDFKITSVVVEGMYTPHSREIK